MPGSRFGREPDPAFVWRQANDSRGLRWPALLLLGIVCVGLGYYVGRVTMIFEPSHPTEQAEPEGAPDSARTKHKRAEGLPPAPAAGAGEPEKKETKGSAVATAAPTQPAEPPVVLAPPRQPRSERAVESAEKAAERLARGERRSARRKSESGGADTHLTPAEERKPATEKWGPPPSYRSWADPGRQ